MRFCKDEVPPAEISSEIGKSARCQINDSVKDDTNNKSQSIKFNRDKPSNQEKHELKTVLDTYRDLIFVV